MSDWPWNLFDQTMAMFERLTLGPNHSVYIHDLAVRARTGAWKFAYVAAVVPIVGLVNALIFWLSLMTTRFFVRELEPIQSWAQRSGLMLGLCVVALVLANVSIFLASTLTSPSTWLVLVLANGSVPSPLLVLGALTSNAFSLYVSDPWLKAVLVASLLPCIIQLTLVTPALAFDLMQNMAKKSRGVLVVGARHRLKRMFFPALMILSTLYFVYWFLRQIV